jgi:hypothetical protein
MYEGSLSCVGVADGAHVEVFGGVLHTWEFAEVEHRRSRPYPPTRLERLGRSPTANDAPRSPTGSVGGPCSTSAATSRPSGTAASAFVN